MNLREETGKRGGLVVLSFNVSLMHDNISYDNIHSKLINAYPIILFGKKKTKQIVQNHSRTKSHFDYYFTNK